MGVAAYNRGSALISRQLSEDPRVSAMRSLVDSLNAVAKREGAQRPWGPARLERGHGGWWLACPKTGFGYWYRTLRAAMREWNIYVAEVDGRGFTCLPMPERR